jgi:hypothetical protein
LPANVSGTWEWKVSAHTGKRDYILNLNQKFQKIDGNLDAEGSNIPIIDSIIEGNKLRFTAVEEIENRKVTHMFNGLVDGNLIEGTMVTKDQMTSMKSNWKAKRDPSTVIPLDE